MRLRMELFVRDLQASVRYYREVLGFAVERANEGYVSLRRGSVVLGLGPIAKLPDDGPGFTRARVTAGRGAGVEIVLELDTVEELRRWYEHVCARTTVTEPLQGRSWGLEDFRLFDPDGYYLRLTHAPPSA